MLVASHLVVFLLNEYFTPVWQKNIRDITREVVLAMKEADKDTAGNTEADSAAKGSRTPHVKHRLYSHSCPLFAFD